MKESLKNDFISQEAHHIAWLKALGFDIESLETGRWVKCCGDGEHKPSGAFAYKTWVNDLREGSQGLLTRAKVHGEEHQHKTLPNKAFSDESCFRLSLNMEAAKKQRIEEQQRAQDEAASKAKFFWDHSSTAGTSDYLASKAVGSYGIRFRYTEKYKNVAVIPLRDINGKLWNYQILNSPFASAPYKKAFSVSGRTCGLFHVLSALINGKPFGIAESYVTAATCYELTRIPTVCAFTCHNLSTVSQILRQKYPDSTIILFADNDRHSAKNEGILRAQEACNSIENSLLLAPDFENYPPGRSASDWNDLLHLRGRGFVLRQLNNLLK
jgi:phage/plasmid primase-like uncharacterized protein